MTTSQDRVHQILYQHTKRPNWGLAVLAWDHVDKRGYHFEDGKLRVFKPEFYDLLEEVDPPADRTRRALEQLSRAVGRHEAVKGSEGAVLIPLSVQIDYFKEQYPDGFVGDAWTKKIRGKGAKKALKRHRDPVLACARKLLAAERLDRLIGAQQYGEVIEALVDVLKETNLVATGKLKPLRAAPHRHRDIAVALRGVLHGEGGFAERFDELIRSIDEASWEMATAVMALWDPERHVCIKPSVFNQQALWMAPRFEARRRPSGRIYERYLEMAQAVAKKLEEAGLHPQDMLDVHDFIYLTLRPAARKLLAGRRPEPFSSPGQEAA